MKKIGIFFGMFLFIVNAALTVFYFSGYSKGVSAAFELKQAERDLQTSLEKNRDLTLKATEVASLAKLEGDSAVGFVPVSALDMKFIKQQGTFQFTQR